MNRKSINGSGDGFAERRLKSVVLNDLIVELGRDGLDDTAVRELITELRRKYPCNETINKLSETLCLEVEAAPEKNGKNSAGEEDGFNAHLADNDQNGQEEITLTSEFCDFETNINIEKILSSDFCKSVSETSCEVQNNEWTIWAS